MLCHAHIRTEEVSNKLAIQTIQFNQLTYRKILKTKDRVIGVCQTDLGLNLDLNICDPRKDTYVLQI